MNKTFGKVRIFGHSYEKDIVIHDDRSITERKKKKSKEFKPIYGHTPLSEKELRFLEKEKPQVVYVGIGYESALPITEGAKKILEKYDTSYAATSEIIEKIEKEKRKFVAIIHVTC